VLLCIPEFITEARGSGGNSSVLGQVLADRRLLTTGGAGGVTFDSSSAGKGGAAGSAGKPLRGREIRGRFSGRGTAGTSGVADKSGNKDVTVKTLGGANAKRSPVH